LHQALRGQPRQRFAHGTLTRIECFLQLADPQGFAGFEAAIQQGVSKLIIGALSQAGRAPGIVSRTGYMHGF